MKFQLHNGPKMPNNFLSMGLLEADFLNLKRENQDEETDELISGSNSQNEYFVE